MSNSGSQRLSFNKPGVTSNFNARQRLYSLKSLSFLISITYTKVEANAMRLKERYSVEFETVVVQKRLFFAFYKNLRLTGIFNPKPDNPEPQLY